METPTNLSPCPSPLPAEFPELIRRLELEQHLEITEGNPSAEATVASQETEQIAMLRLAVQK